MDRFNFWDNSDKIPGSLPSPENVIVEQVSIEDRTPFLLTIVPDDSDGVINPGDGLSYEADVSIDPSSDSGCLLVGREYTYYDTWLKVGYVEYTSSTDETIQFPCDGSSVSISKDFPAPGTGNSNREKDFDVELLLGDLAAGSSVSVDSDSMTVYEEIEPPEASIDAPSTVDVGESFDLDASGSSGEELSYSWDVDGSGESGESVSTSFDSEGSYSVDLTVEDWQGQTDSASTTIQAELEDVDADISGAGSSMVGEEVEFDGQYSQGHDGIDSYTWEIDGEQVSSSSSFTRTFDEPGDYTVELTVEDGAGQQDTTTETHTVELEKPTASFSVPSSVEAGESVTLDASESSEGSYAIEEYNWNVDSETLTGETTTTSFVEDGEREIQLEVVDVQGNTATESATVLVDAEAPQAAISVQADQLAVGEEITFSGEDSEPGSSDIEDYQWTVDGESAFGESTRFVFEEPGNKTVELTVVDAQDRENTVSKTVQIIEDSSSDDGDDSSDGSDSGDDSDGEDGSDGADDGDGSSDGDGEDDSDEGFFSNLWSTMWGIFTYG